eukprot:2242790-Rhodomonas_salina.1
MGEEGEKEQDREEEEKEEEKEQEGAGSVIEGRWVVLERGGVGSFKGLCLRSSDLFVMHVMGGD